MSSLQFHSVLLEISNQLSGEQLKDLKYLCGDMIGKGKMEKITTGTQLFQVLTERTKLGPDKLDYLSQLLKEIKRPDLSNKLECFESQSGYTDNQPEQKERDKLDLATNVIVENVGRRWRKLGRSLNLSEVKLDSIARRHPDDLEETDNPNCHPPEALICFICTI
ncbi:protein FADD isoform X2 [Centropristis striata]|uniref:protein FADD isoform X2 n=1 Tax=Centropristis striata TaxID=184440 RepID=UPI0027E0F7C1|nr:protein FADD isoform X2 [Centropristis striata]